jgi:NAD(P)H-dependent FMN reductase
MTRILAFAGSIRRDSLNQMLARAAAEMATAAGADATFVDLRGYPMPLYDGDLEAKDGPPATALDLARQLQAADGLLIACPEYNSSITPLLKNTIDWVSRTGVGDAGGPGLDAFKGKVIGLLAASPGGFGGLRGLVTVRSIFGNIGAFVVPTQVALPKALGVFAADGSFTDARTADKVRGVVAEVVVAAERLRSS